jgi:hypothetical protein
LNHKLQRLEDLHCFQADLDLRKRRLAASLANQQRQHLRDALPKADEALIDRLLEMDIDGDTLPALQLAPLAAVAWASGSVTHEENAQAILAIFDSQVSGNPKAVEKVRSWLQRRPPSDLLDLWEDFVLQTQHQLDDTQWEYNGDLLMQNAQAIALASGGVLGFGSICKAEHEILDRIARVYLI